MYPIFSPPQVKPKKQKPTYNNKYIRTVPTSTLTASPNSIESIKSTSNNDNTNHRVNSNTTQTAAKNTTSLSAANSNLKNQSLQHHNHQFSQKPGTHEMKEDENVKTSESSFSTTIRQ